MRVGLNANPNKPLAGEVARSLLTLFDRRAEVVLTDETQELLGSELPGRPLPEIDADIIVSVGGDGTFLATLQRTHLPVLPVNAGTFGFLAEVDGRDTVALGTAIDRLLEGRYFTEYRMRLGCRANDKELPNALNEIVVHT
ncbi:MAG: NAD(+)/NADH kinase, partial [Thermoplasmata archaeon]